jgi:DNA-directed RNA polymerase subunit RPC12/RpoP
VSSESDSDFSNGNDFSPKPSTSRSNVKKEKIEIKPDVPQNDWSDDDDVPLTNLKDDFEFNPPSPENKKPQLPRRLRAKIFRENLTEAEKLAGGVAFGKHKMRKLVGVPACRYCDSIFTDRRERDAHDCKYLRCDPKNFICRFCGKELSKKTFSNHVHEAAACQYCGKKVLNPRQMKKHIAARHKGKFEGGWVYF